MKVTRRLFISGRVQGVYYRESMRIEAERLGVTGWVRNRASGDVEAMIHGEADVVEAMIGWAWQGPPAADVNAVMVEEAEGVFATFERIPTA